MAKRKQRQRTWKEPPELTRIRESFTDPQMRTEFEKWHRRPPQSEGELEVWFELHTLSLYNSGRDVTPGQPQDPA